MEEVRNRVKGTGENKTSLNISIVLSLESSKCPAYSKVK